MPYDNDTTYEFCIDEQDAGYCEEHGLKVIYEKAIATVRCTEMQLQRALGLV